MTYINNIKSKLNAQFDITDIGEVNTILGIEIVRL